MTEGQKVHRLLGCLYQQSKKAVFYEDLLVDFNDGLWFGRIDEKELLSICSVLVHDELAIYISGSHAAAGVLSDKESSKGISITNNAYIAFINKKYIEGNQPSPWPKVIVIGSIAVTLAAVAYGFYMRNQMNYRIDQLQVDLERTIMEKERVSLRTDSVIAKKDSIINRQALRIKDLESKPVATQPAKSKKSVKRRR